MWTFCKIIFCCILSIACIGARPHEPVHGKAGHSYGAAMATKLKDGLFEETVAVRAKQYLQNLLNKRTPLTTAIHGDGKSGETTAASVLAKTIFTTTKEPTTTASLRAEPLKAAATLSYISANVDEEENPLNHLESTSIFPVVVYPTPIFQQPTLSYFPVAYYALRSTGMKDMKPTTYGYQKSALGPSSSMSSIANGSQLPKAILEGFSGYSLMPAYNTYTMHMMTPVYNQNHFFKS